MYVCSSLFFLGHGSWIVSGSFSFVLAIKTGYLSKN